jgi:hypothetical protein
MKDATGVEKNCSDWLRLDEVGLACTKYPVKKKAGFLTSGLRAGKDF